MISQASSPPLSSNPAGYRMNSPLLFEMLNHLAAEQYHQFLDITPASHGLLEFFAHYHCKLYLPGCIDELWRMPADEPVEHKQLQTVLAQVMTLPEQPAVKLNMILLWDIINYLDKPVLTALMDYLLSYTGQRTVIHSYIHTRQTMPAVPGRYHFTGDGGIDVVPGAMATMPSPAYYQEVLHKLLKPFVVKRSILLANGMQEYLFELPRAQSFHL